MMPLHDKPTNKLVYSGKDLQEAKKAMVLLHGRGSNPSDILSLARYFPLGDFALLAPEAPGHTWYPYPFIVNPEQNEPALSSALEVLEETLQTIKQSGIEEEEIYILGFSQGACLMLEFIARNATLYGGALAFSGGLIGDKIYRENYKGDFRGTPVFIGSSNPDFHIPVERVYATTNVLKEMHADVMEKVYDNMGHTIISDEIEQAKRWVFKE